MCIHAYFLLGPCGKPEDVPHTKVNGSSYNVEDTLTYSCEKGYTLNGPKIRTCGEDAKWSVAPTCTRKSSKNPGKGYKLPVIELIRSSIVRWIFDWNQPIEWNQIRQNILSMSPV